MKLGIMQPYFLPYIGYWQLLNTVDRYVIYEDVNFIKSGWINRNRILMNGKAKMISLPIHGASQNKHINELNLLGDVTYNKKLLKIIECCYKKAPYYSKAFPVIESIINHDEKNLAKYLEYSIRQVSKYLFIDTEIIVSSKINKNNDLKGQEKVIEMCKVMGADKYYNSIGGQELYSYTDFAASKIQLNFLKTKAFEYKQFNNEFVSNLSIIDVMMFNSAEDLKKILDQYELI